MLQFEADSWATRHRIGTGSNLEMKMNQLFSTDKFINIAAAIGLLALMAFVLTMSTGPLIMAAAAAMLIMARATHCEHQEAGNLQMMAGNPRIKQGLPTDWDDPAGVAPSNEGVVEENIRYSQGKRKDKPQSLRDLEHAEEVTDRPPWIENPGKKDLH